MRAKRKPASPAFAVSVLLVGSPSAVVDRTESDLSASGFMVTRADNICYAELFAETQYFDAAVYTSSLSPEEQVSLARIMRVRWPWMRLVRCGYKLIPAEDSLFDGAVASEPDLPAKLSSVLAG